MSGFYNLGRFGGVFGIYIPADHYTQQIDPGLELI